MFSYLRAKFRRRAFKKTGVHFDGTSLPSLIKAVRQTTLSGTDCATGRALVEQTPQQKFYGVTARVHIKAELKDVSKKSA